MRVTKKANPAGAGSAGLRRHANEDAIERVFGALPRGSFTITEYEGTVCKRFRTLTVERVVFCRIWLTRESVETDT